MSTARCGRRSSSTCCRMRSSSRSKAAYRCVLKRDGTHAVLEVSDTGIGVAAARSAAPVRAFSPRRRRAGAHPRRFRHRPRAGAGTRQAARRLDRGRERSRAAARRSGCAFLSAMRISRPSSATLASRPAPPRSARKVFVAGGAALAAGCTARRQRAPLKRQRTARARAGDLRFASTFGQRIVLADDNADMRSYVSDWLGRLYDIEAVGDGLLALEAARREPPALIISDVMMPQARRPRPAAGAARRSQPARGAGDPAVGARRRRSAHRGPEHRRR